MEINSPHIALDTENFYSSKLGLSVRVMSPEQYAAHPMFECFMVSTSDGTNNWSGAPEAFDWASLNGKTVVCHNLRYDRAIINEMIRRGQIPSFSPKEWFCTASMTAYLANRRSLAEAVEYFYKTRLSKDVRDGANGKHWADFSTDEKQKMLEYAKSDAVWTWRLFNDQGSRWPKHERLIANWTIQRGAEGVAIDAKLLDQYLIAIHDCKMETQKLLPWLHDEWDNEEDEFNPKPTSTKCIAEHCRRVGIPCPPIKAHEGEEAFAAWEEQYGMQHSWIPALSSWRSVNKLLKLFERMKERLGPDDVMPFGQRYCGTITGRVSGESNLNLFNQRKQALLIDERGLMETSDIRVDAAHKERKKTGAWPAWVKQPIDIRNLIIARPGKQLLTSDLSNIEPRCAAYIAGDTAFLDLIRQGYNCYAAHAIATMGWDPARDLKAEAPETYNLAKCRELSLGYGASWRKLIGMARVYGIDITANDPETVEEVHPYTGEIRTVSGYGAVAKATVKSYRDARPKTVAAWRALDDGLRRSIGEDFVVTLPSGRQLRFEKVRAETRIEPDPDNEGKPRRRTIYTCDAGSRRTTTYGSKIFGEICQSFARDIFYDAVLRIEAAGICVRLGVYDECVIELDNPDRADEVTKLMTTPPAWLPNFPLATETKLLACYAK